MIIEFTYIGQVPTINKCYRENRYGRRFLATPAKEYKINVISYFIEKYGIKHKPFWNKKIDLTLMFFYKRKGRDIDNAEKLTIDSLQGYCFENDKQIYKKTTYKYDRDIEGVTIRIKEYTDPSDS